MSTDQMTDTEALAHCLAPVLDGAATFGAAEHEKASATAVKLLQDGKVDSGTFSRIVVRMGNHSAMRQWAIKMGLIPQSDAKPDALCLAIRAIFAKRDKDLEDMANASEKKEGAV